MDSRYKNADVALFRADRYKAEDMGWWEYQDEDKGHFEFNHVSPGKGESHLLKLGHSL